MRRFHGVRPQPPGEHTDTGVTDAGLVREYEGVEFMDGTVVINWRPLYRNLLLWDSFTDFEREHGHALTGVVVFWLDPQQPALTHTRAGHLRSLRP